jgi:MFS family permease
MRTVSSISSTSNLQTTDVPARLDRLPWSGWHRLVVFALGITWILDGLEVTVVGAIGTRLQDPQALGLTATQVGAAASSYLTGAVVGALVFGYLTDRLGRKRLFLVTLALYLVATLATSTSWSFLSFAAFRFATGLGIGGEYAAINSAIDELIPARHRGWVDLAVNGSWWLGTIAGSAESLVLLDPHVIDQTIGWRLVFALGAVIGIAVLLIRRFLPESPRWLMTHGRIPEAEAVVAQIERETRSPSRDPAASIAIDPASRAGFARIVETLVLRYPSRTIVALSLMIAQAFLYNAIFFTEALVLKTFFNVPAQDVGWYIFPFAAGNLLGPWLLGRLFDVIGRRAMIGATYVVAGALLAGTAAIFDAGKLNAATITVCWSVVFFFASAGASAAYLTASEIFPIEARAQAIAFVYAAGTLVGGVAAPGLFGALIATASRSNVGVGYLVGAAFMIAGGIVEWFLGVDAERRPLEEVALPLAAIVPVHDGYRR